MVGVGWIEKWRACGLGREVVHHMLNNPSGASSHVMKTIGVDNSHWYTIWWDGTFTTNSLTFLCEYLVCWWISCKHDAEFYYSSHRQHYSQYKILHISFDQKCTLLIASSLIILWLNLNRILFEHKLLSRPHVNSIIELQYPCQKCHLTFSRGLLRGLCISDRRNYAAETST